MPKRRRLIVGNWKMYGRLTSGMVLARDLVERAEANKPLNFDIVICPPATLCWPISEIVMGGSIMLGAQDCHTATHGAYTGDLSAAMFADLGCRYVIVGHSERRLAHGETNKLVAEKLEAVQLAGLHAILCVGETAEQLAAGLSTSVIEQQIKECIPEKSRMANITIAYEPVWAIGTGQQPSPADIVMMHQVIRKALGPAGDTMRVIYGGSVSSVNARAILDEFDVDGVLVGSASLNADGFWAIAEMCR